MYTIEGFAISRPKIAEFFDIKSDTEIVETTVNATIRWLDKNVFMFIACGIRSETRRLVM